MARSARVRRGGPGYAGLITFIVLCIILILGYVWLVPEYAKVSASLDTMHQHVKDNLEDRVGGPLQARAIVRARKADLAYDATFFRKVADSAEDGLKYPPLLALTGWEEAEDPAKAIEEFLALTPQDSLQTYVNELNSRRLAQEKRVQVINQSLQAVEAQRDRAMALSQEAVKQRDEARAGRDAKLAEARSKYLGEIVKMKRLQDQADKIAANARGDLAKAVAGRKADVAELDGRIERLEQDKKELQAELQRKKPKPVAVMEGRILQVDYVNRVAIIDLGKREGIKEGEKFTVMRIGRGGVPAAKGELQVVRVEENVSRADIMSQTDENDLITRLDVVRRQKQVE